MSHKLNVILSGTLLSGVLLAASGTAHATPYYWIGPDNGSWNSSANWLPFGVPGANDDAFIGVKKKVLVPLDAAVTNLTVGAGSEIRNTGKIKVTGKTNSFGLFIGLGALEIPLGGNATFNVDATNALAAVTGTSPAVVFAPLNNKGTLITKVAAGCRVDFASVQNNGATQIVSDGKVTFKDIKNTQQLDVSSAGELTFAKLENANGAKLNITSTIPSLLGSVPNIVGGLLGALAGTTSSDSDPSVVNLDSLINRAGGTVKLTGMAGSRFFDGSSILNEGDLQLSGARTMLEADLTNAASGTLTLDSDAFVFPSDGKVPKVRNFGKIIKPAGHDATLNVDWTNNGDVIIENGTLNVSVPLGKGCKQTGGTTTLEGGTLAVKDPLGLLPLGTFDLAGGVLDGIGTIKGNVVNSAGRVSPGHSPGSITINGNYTQTANGVLDMEIGGTDAGSSYDQILVNGTANFDGTINFVRWGNFVPKDGDVFTLFSYYSKTGKFAKFVDASPVAGVTYATTLTPSTFEVDCTVASTTSSKETTAPVITITDPLNNDGDKSIAAATGKASDASGIKLVTCRLYRYANPVTGAAAGFWAGGTTWTSSATVANDLAVKGTTAWTFAFPTLAAGRYSLIATATDTVGNKSTSSTSAFWVDPNAPSVLTIDTPANSSTVTSLSSLNGTASDASDGSGVVSVQSQLRRLADNYYWNGTAWVTSAVSLGNTLSGTKWARTASLPTGTNLKAGKYTLTVTATDRAGNAKTVSSTFTANPTAASSKIKASSKTS